MTLPRTLIALALLGLVAACGGPGDSAEVPQAQPAAATSADIGDYVVHFIAQTTDELPPEIARAYKIVRSANRAMLNVSVIRKADNKSVAAAIEVSTRNLTGQLKNVTMRRIEEPGDTTAILVCINPTGAGPWFASNESSTPTRLSDFRCFVV